MEIKQTIKAIGIASIISVVLIAALCIFTGKEINQRPDMTIAAAEANHVPVSSSTHNNTAIYSEEDISSDIEYGELIEISTANNIETDNVSLPETSSDSDTYDETNEFDDIIADAEIDNSSLKDEDKDEDEEGDNPKTGSANPRLYIIPMLLSIILITAKRK